MLCTNATKEGRDSILYRKPEGRDGGSMWRIARESGGLDLNSPYAYLLFAEHFSDTCIVAEADGETVGFVIGFRPPARADTLFVWQIAVEPAHRGNGVGVGMLTTLMEDLAEDLRHDGVCFLEATVTPSNVASQRMFRSFAESVEAAFEQGVTPLFSQDMFPGGEEHEEERAIRIGPVDTTKREAAAPAATTARKEAAFE